MPAIRIPNSAMPAFLRGFVDRVDAWEDGSGTYLRVADYKTFPAYAANTYELCIYRLVAICNGRYDC